MLDRYRSDRDGLFDDVRAGSFDELLDDDGGVRPRWAPVVARYTELGEDGLRAADLRVRTLIDDDGITYNATDGESTSRRRWELDCVPLLIDGERWASLERGVEQRTRVLDALLADIYGDQRMIAAGVLPPELVYGHPGYLRRAARQPRNHPHALFMHACDIGRTSAGEPVVYADWAQAPSGIGYAVADRRLMARVFPRLLHACVPRPLTAFAATLRLALFEYAPQGIEDPVVAVLTPGSLSETAFDQAYLASMLGFPLVEAADLVVRDGTVYMRSLGKFKRLDVILRRVDAEYADPLDLRADSRLGVTGLVEAVSRGTVTVVNTLGSAVLENPALAAYLPALSRALLDEDLVLASVPTLWGGASHQLGGLLDGLSSMTIVNFRTGEQFVGGECTSAQLDDLRARIDATAWQWVGQRIDDFSVAPSTTPGTVASSNMLRAAPVGIRAFSVAQGSGYAVMPGGLGHVLADGLLTSPTNSIAAKDVWVTTSEPAARVGDSAGRRVHDVGTRAADVDMGMHSDTVFASSPRVLSDLFWFGRYGERAELTTRMVKVARERYEDFRYRPWMTGTASIPLFLAAVITASGSASKNSDDATDPIAVLRALTGDHQRPGSVAFAVDRLAQVARAVRDQMSTSTWMVLGAIDRALDELAASAKTDPESADLGRTHDDVLHGLLALSGLQAESMVRDPGWQFMDIGRRIERAQVLAALTTAILAEQYDPDVEQGLMEAYLVANESAIIYRRRNRGIYRLAAVVAVMLFDEANPRSMIFQLATLRSDLVTLPDAVRSAAAERVVEDLTTALRRVDPVDLATVDDDGHRSELAELMQTLDAGVREITEILGRTRFSYPVDMQPLWGAGSEDHS
ncbi:circularly permuted type 2 ATP-grasp protein [Gordonia sp. TBRC 11910]|uniref:Circularly permuted type 2 ATP-grasp protein n=1 Tax=Gordonia asplenii TaxID=2725283 RepID=A0A848L9A8_9ACTN|nr:circularly permuted type 2 ATP-grasp protein [Gordonia asplenii]